MVRFCGKMAATDRSLCLRHIRHKSSGVSLELKDGCRWKKSGRPTQNIYTVKFPKKKLQREKRILKERGIDIEDMLTKVNGERIKRCKSHETFQSIEIMILGNPVSKFQTVRGIRWPKA